MGIKNVVFIEIHYKFIRFLAKFYLINVNFRKSKIHFSIVFFNDKYESDIFFPGTDIVYLQFDIKYLHSIVENDGK